MKYALFYLLTVISLLSKAQDTLFLEDKTDPRYLRYLDSIYAYETGYSVARNIADSVERFVGNNVLDVYFLGMYNPAKQGTAEGYFYDFHENATVEIGKVSVTYRGMKDQAKFPWQYLEKQYKRLDSIKIQPWGIMQGGELPNVYVYAKPALTVIYQKVRRYTVVDPSIKFFKNEDGKTTISYITKYYYSQVWGQLQKIDSIEKLDPITKKHLFY